MNSYNESGQAGTEKEQEIQITPEMIEALTDFLIESGFLLYDERKPVRRLAKDGLSLCLSRSNLKKTP